MLRSTDVRSNPFPCGAAHRQIDCTSEFCLCFPECLVRHPMRARLEFFEDVAAGSWAGTSGALGLTAPLLVFCCFVLPLGVAICGGIFFCWVVKQFAVEKPASAVKCCRQTDQNNIEHASLRRCETRRRISRAAYQMLSSSLAPGDERRSSPQGQPACRSIERYAFSAGFACRMSFFL